MAADTTTSRVPDARFLFSHPAHFIALGFGSGLAPKAPGTFGTLAALGIYWLLATTLAPLTIAYLAIPLFVLGIWACEVTAHDLGKGDPGCIVWDEIVAFLPLAALSSKSLMMQLVAFGLFRLFDIWKPFPIRQVERRVKGGFGVMVDDLFAAAYAYLVILVLVLASRRYLESSL
jgi:phosphatidylglycerophosphatase A